jgi:hypothetical protein
MSTAIGTLYGLANQSIFQKNTNDISNQAVDFFKSAISSGKDLEELFHETLDLIATQYKELRKLEDPDNKKFYGIRRDQDPFPGPCPLTALGHPYWFYHKLVKNRLLEEILPMLKEGQKNKETLEDCFLDRKCNLSLKLVSFEDAVETQETLNLDVETLLEDRKQLLELKEKSPKTYHSLLETLQIGELTKTHNQVYDNFAKLRPSTPYSGKKISQYLIATLQLKTDKKTSPLSSLVMGVFANATKKSGSYDPDDMIKQTEKMPFLASIAHLEPFLIESMLEEIAGIFKRAMQWSPALGIQVLKNDMILFHYYLAHAMPFCRGSAAISEIFENAVYSYFDIPFEYIEPEGRAINLEALTLTLKEFADSYDSLVKLTPKPSNIPEALSKEEPNISKRTPEESTVALKSTDKDTSQACFEARSGLEPRAAPTSSPIPEPSHTNCCLVS